MIFPSGDLTDKQKKIFMENQFYRGLSIPEPREMVSLGLVGLHLNSRNSSTAVHVQVVAVRGKRVSV